jgi:hypothetical protein
VSADVTTFPGSHAATHPATSDKTQARDVDAPDKDGEERLPNSCSRMECAPSGGQIGSTGIDRGRAFLGRMPMPRRHRGHGAVSRRQVVAEDHAGETLPAL